MVDPSLVLGTAPRANHGGRVMCLLATGDGRVTALRFDYAHPPVPPAPSRHWHAAKWAFKGLSCPLPIVTTAVAIKRLRPGTVFFTF